MKKPLFIALSYIFLSSMVWGQNETPPATGDVPGEGNTRINSWGFLDADRSWIGLGDGEAADWYSLWDNGVGTFNGADLGKFIEGGNYQIWNWDIKTWGASADGAQIFVTIYEQNNRPVEPQFEEWWQQNPEVIGGENRIWRGFVESGSQGGDAFRINILDGLGVGTYSLEVYIRAWGHDPEENFDNNDGDNFIADFEVIPPPPVESNVIISTGVTSNGAWSGGTPDIWTPTGAGANVDVAEIVSRLNDGKSVSIGGGYALNITVSNDIEKTAGGDATLTLDAGSLITIEADISSTSDQLNFVADVNNNFIISSAGSITTNGGDIAVTADKIENSGSLIANKGNVKLDAGVSFLQQGEIKASGGNISITARDAYFDFGKTSVASSEMEGGWIKIITTNSLSAIKGHVFDASGALVSYSSN